MADDKASGERSPGCAVGPCQRQNLAGGQAVQIRLAEPGAVNLTIAAQPLVQIRLRLEQMDPDRIIEPGCEQFGKDLQRWIHVGASPRGTLALDKGSRAHAWLDGRDHVTPDDVRAIVHDCLRHRVILSYEANADGLSADDVINELVKQVAVA